MKRIIFVHLYNDRSGSPKVLSQTIQGLASAGHNCSLVTSAGLGGFLSELPVKSFNLFYKRSENRFLTLFYYLMTQLQILVMGFFWFRGKDIVYVNTLMPFGALLCAKLMRKKIICHVHETSIKPFIFKRFLRFFVSLCADKVIYVSNYLKSVEYFPGLDYVVIGNALDSMPSAFIDRSKRDDFIVLMVCSLKAYKGVFEFIELASMMVGHVGIKFELVLNADNSEIDDYLGSVSYGCNLRVYSRQQDLSSFYFRASVLVNFSRPDQWIETFGLTVIEGASYSLPVIVPEVGAPSEYVTNGIDGYQISCYELERVVDVLDSISKDSEEYFRLSMNAYVLSKKFCIKTFKSNITVAVDALYGN